MSKIPHLQAEMLRTQQNVGSIKNASFLGNVENTSSLGKYRQYQECLIHNPSPRMRTDNVKKTHP